MKISVLSAVAILTVSLGIPFSVFAADIHLRVGERKVIAANQAQGVVLDNSGIADVQIVGGTQVEIVGKAGGEGVLVVYARDGKTKSYAIRVIGATRAKRAERPAFFGGKKIPNAQCTDPAEGKPATQALEQARALADDDRLEEAIEHVDRVLDANPRAVSLHLFLGAAWAKLKDQARGAYHYETFVLSCPEHPTGKAVAELLHEFDRRLASPDYF